MSDDQAAQRTKGAKAKKAGRLAKKAAAEQGQDWKEMSKEDRKTFKSAAREKMKRRAAGKKPAATET